MILLLFMKKGEAYIWGGFMAFHSSESFVGK